MKERMAGVPLLKSQMLLTELSPLTYWISVTVWNALIYVTYCLLLIAIFYTFGWLKDATTG